MLLGCGQKQPEKLNRSLRAGQRCLGFLGLAVQDLGFRGLGVQGLGFRVQGLGFPGLGSWG